MRSQHQRGHYGSTALAKTIIASGHRWSSISRDCQEFVADCPDCQRFTIRRRGYHPLSPILAKLPMDQVAIDLAQLPTSTDGYNYVLLVVDSCTRFTFLYPLQAKSAIEVAKALISCFTIAGFPRVLQSDHGTEFANAVIRALLRLMEVEHRMATPYHPRANGLAERSVRTMKDLLLKELKGKDTHWPAFSNKVQFAMNQRAVLCIPRPPLVCFSHEGLYDWKIISQPSVDQ